MNAKQKHMVTGAFGLSGRYIARRLLALGHHVETLTNTKPAEDPFGGAVISHPLDFNDAEGLARSLDGVDVFYNTYWVRFDHKRFNHERAVRNTQLLFAAAQRAGVCRVVHVSITNPDENSPLPYFKGKAQLEKTLRESGIPHAILRPAVLFGDNAILLNNIAWMLRRFPIFGIFGDGQYRIEPIHVDDLAALAVEHGANANNITVDAKGPESFTYRDLVHAIGKAIGHDRPQISIPPWLGYWGGRMMGAAKDDVVITREEIRGLMAGLLATDSVPTAPTRLTDWLAENGEWLGRTYQNELRRRQ
ncbi:MAG: NmrA family NAD(P)-binding protein [Puniceicoccales bacterium]|jgi:NADH dehydrogenase|nr:NmrA family NAD(P)-binding protein [Puniceicoccales bacterium]